MITLGFILLFIAGMSDGSMYLPAKYTRNWRWEHYWSVFSLTFFVISWVLTFILVPDIFSIYSGIAAKDIIILAVFGALWGVGAILFGLSCYLVGMALTFPIVLGTVAVVGSLIPLMTTEADSLFTPKGGIVIIGLLITVAGIVVCSRAYKIKEDIESQTQAKRATSVVGGLLVAVFAGVFSALLNVGFSFGDNVTARAVEFGASQSFASTAVWALFFSVAFVVNLAYCLFLMIKHNTLQSFFGPEIKRNLLLGIAMGAFFTCAIFIYSVGATFLGSWGEVPGWVVFMSVDIITGNVWGLVTGEWATAPRNAHKLLKLGTAVIIIAIIVVALSQALN
ncbi:L-rhamnose/proton symporter RhaT [Planctomycetota bacterium]